MASQGGADIIVLSGGGTPPTNTTHGQKVSTAGRVNVEALQSAPLLTAMHLEDGDESFGKQACYGSLQQEPAGHNWDKPPGRFQGFCCCNQFNCCSQLAQVILSATLTGSFLIGFNVSLLNTALNSIAAEFEWCGCQGYIGCRESLFRSAVLNTAVILGAAAGAMTAGRYLSFGCRKVTCANMVLLAIGVFFSVSAEGYITLMGARLLVGYSIGIMCVVTPTYLSEITPAAERGKYGAVHQLFFTSGNFVAVLLGLPLSMLPSALPSEVEPTQQQLEWTLPHFDRIWWRVMLGLGIVPVALALYIFLFVFNFETPYYYVKEDRMVDAITLLRRLRKKTDDVSAELDEISRTIRATSEARRLPLSSAIKEWRYGRIILLGCIFATGQQFVGINAFMTASNKLFQEAGLEGSAVTAMSCIVTALQALMTFPAMFLVEYLGRRPLLLMGLCGMIVSVAPGATALWLFPGTDSTGWISIAGAFGFIVFYGVSYGPVNWIYLFEMFPAEIKDGGSGTAAASNWLSACVMVFMAVYVGTEVNYSIFLAMQVVFLVFTYFFIKETRGLPVGESPYLSKGIH